MLTEKIKNGALVTPALGLLPCYSLQWCHLIHWQLNCLSKAYSNIKEYFKAWHHWLFARGIHQWSVDSPNKGPVMWKTFLCDDVIRCCPVPCLFWAQMTYFQSTKPAIRHTVIDNQYVTISRASGDQYGKLFVSTHFRDSKQHTSFCNGVCVRNYMMAPHLRCRIDI